MNLMMLSVSNESYLPLLFVFFLNLVLNTSQSEAGDSLRVRGAESVFDIHRALPTRPLLVFWEFGKKNDGCVCLRLEKLKAAAVFDGMASSRSQLSVMNTFSLDELPK